MREREEHKTETVDEFQVHMLAPGQAARVEGYRIGARGEATNDQLVVTVMMTNHAEAGDGHPFAGLMKIYGIGIASSNTRLLDSAAPCMNTWVGDTIRVGQKWNAGTYRAGRAIQVSKITVIHS